jgi:hypothetical protein
MVELVHELEGLASKLLRERTVRVVDPQRPGSTL